MQQMLGTPHFVGRMEGLLGCQERICLVCWRKPSRLGGGADSLEERRQSRLDAGRTRETTFGINNGNVPLTQTRPPLPQCRMNSPTTLFPSIATRPSPAGVKLCVLKPLFQCNRFSPPRVLTTFCSRAPRSSDNMGRLVRRSTRLPIWPDSPCNLSQLIGRCAY